MKCNFSLHLQNINIFEKLLNVLIMREFMNKIIEFFKSLIGKTGKSEQKSEEVQTSQTSQTSQNTKVDSLKSTKTVKKTADSVNAEKKTTKRCGRPRKVKAE